MAIDPSYQQTRTSVGGGTGGAAGAGSSTDTEHGAGGSGGFDRANENDQYQNQNRRPQQQHNHNHTQVFSSQHADYVLATALDIYGRRMATASGDRSVRIWDLQADGNWHIVAAWQAHRSAVTAVSWAHAEFGSLLATAGADHDVKIWEEMSHSNVAATTTTHSSGTTVAAGNNNTASSSSRWNLTASLTDARRGVTCVEFAPRQWGLKIATGSSDGTIRIYEAVDIMNLSQWPLAATIAAFEGSGGGSGGFDTASGTTSNSATNAHADTSTMSGIGGGCTSLSWCTGRFDPPTIAVGGSHVLVYRYSDATRAWQSVLSIPFVTGVGADILDVAWAPNVGRRFHALAMVTSNNTVRVVELSRSTLSGGNSNSSTLTTASSSANNDRDNATNSTSTSSAPGTAATSSSSSIQILRQQDIVAPNSWRCQWNVTGTVLAIAGDAGMVKLYKRDDENGQYVDVAKISGELRRVDVTNATGTTATAAAAAPAAAASSSSGATINK